MLKESDILLKAKKAIRECFSLIPSCTINIIEQSIRDRADLRATIRNNQSEQLLLVEVKTIGTPKSTRIAVNALRQYLYKAPGAYGVFIAPYITHQSAKICEEAGIGYIDLSGNCKLAFQQVFINKENFENKYPFKSGLVSLYNPKSERILRVLLTFPFRLWNTLELAQEAGVSPGMISHVRKKLDEQEWIKSSKKGFQLINPKALLSEWSVNYSFHKHTLKYFYTINPLFNVEMEISKACNLMKIGYAITGFSASNRLAPVVRNQRATIYIKNEIQEVAEKFGLRNVTSGANVILVQPYDEGVFWNSQMVDEIEVATPIQVYLDLINTSGRGEEAAKFLYKEVIYNSWQR